MRLAPYKKSLEGGQARFGKWRVIEERLHHNEIAIAVTGVGMVAERKGVTVRLCAELEEWCREHIGPVEVVAAPSYGSATGFALRGSDADLLMFRLRWR